VRHLPAELTPQHFHRSEPGTGGWEGEPHQSSGRGPHEDLALSILLGPGMIPGALAGPCRSGVCPGRSASTSSALSCRRWCRCKKEDDGCSRVLVHGSKAVLRGRWSWGGPHHRLPLGAAHGPQRRQPTQLELSGGVEDIPSAQPLTGVFQRLLLTASSGSGPGCCWEVGADSRQARPL
jgi:hypothetical protein